MIELAAALGYSMACRVPQLAEFSRVVADVLLG